MDEAEVRRLARELIQQKLDAAAVVRESYTVIKKEGQGIKREVEGLDDEEFQARYKARRMASGRFEVDLTED
ncbi:hypothetical protein B0H67DRAFT_640291 [Lasiosphaeris hirsuta]|uniref:Uncharacterized protein n=1 Tax=Lasiosphaeris hirsuta TaxID=260670 RepID=A0AA40BCY9_9PEZI|nr:hypothetical protein B0H67DRAFT_640291 [Lasiosphaeris hirsuta]